MDKQVIVYQKESLGLVNAAHDIVIENGDHMKGATELLSRLNKFLDKITEEKERVTKPLNEALKAERSRWKPVETNYDEAIEILRKKMSDYQTAKVREEREEKEKIAARVGEGKGKLKVETAVRKMDEVEVAPSVVSSDEGIVKFRTDRKLKITDESVIPREYLVVNEKKLLDALKQGVVVPGAEIEEVQTPINFR